MKIYVTRHGQVGADAEYYNGDPSLPKREVLLSDLGREQALLLGRRLSALGFHGDIYASPFVRTMETAEIIAKETGSKIVPAAWIHEIFLEHMLVYQGNTLERLKERYSHIAEGAQLAYPWWPSYTETNEMVYQRVSAGIETLLQRKDTDEEILLVGHGASINAANRYLGLEREWMLWNCSLGMYDTKHPEQNFGIDISHLPREMVTNNRMTISDYEKES